MWSKKLTTVLVSLVALVAAAAGAARAQTGPELTEEFHQTYPLAADGRVSLSNVQGRVRVLAWDRNEVKVDAVKRAYKPERLREAEIRVSTGAGYIEIETEYPSYSFNRDSNWTREDQAASVEYTLTVPRAARLDNVSTVSGGLELDGLAGEIEASSVSGRVVARGLTGRVRLSVVSGRLEASFDRLSEANPISLSSVSGVLVVTLPSDANAQLRAGTVNGAITNDFGLPVRRGEHVGRDLAGRLGSGGARISLSNVSGPIQIRRAADGRAPSPVTNLLSETRGDGDFEGETDERAVAREALREAREAKAEAARERREAQREAARERAEALREAQRETAQERAEAAREIQREAAETAREAQRTAREVERSVRRDLKGVTVYDDSRRQIERESNTMPVNSPPRVRIETFDGPVTIRAWDKSEVMYTAIKRAYDEREMKGVKIHTQALNSRREHNGKTTGTDSEIVIRAEFDKAFARDYVERQGKVVSFSSGASVEFDVYVPRNASVVVTSGDGRLMVEGVRGELTLRTGDGPIDVTEASGKLRADTGDGRIRIEGFEGEADARTGDGGISLAGNFRQLAARTGDGTISLALPDGANAIIETNATSVINDGVAVAEDTTESRVRRWRVGGGGQLFTLRTGDGQIILRRR
jgi:DUF4097 and DUF4098 domain-containing protein YvlB